MMVKLTIVLTFNLIAIVRCQIDVDLPCTTKKPDVFCLGATGGQTSLAGEGKKTEIRRIDQFTIVCFYQVVFSAKNVI